MLSLTGVLLQHNQWARAPSSKRGLVGRTPHGTGSPRGKQHTAMEASNKLKPSRAARLGEWTPRTLLRATLSQPRYSGAVSRTRACTQL